jgi:hypothetical protein
MPLSAEQRRERACAAIVEAVDMLPDGRAKKWREEHLVAMDESANPPDLAARVRITLHCRR